MNDNYICLIIKKITYEDSGLTVVEYVIGAAFLVGALVLFFQGEGGILSNKLSQVVE